VEDFSGEQALQRAFGLRGAVGLPLAEFNQVEKIVGRDMIKWAIGLELDLLNDLPFKWGIGSKETRHRRAENQTQEESQYRFSNRAG